MLTTRTRGSLEGKSGPGAGVATLAAAAAGVFAGRAQGARLALVDGDAALVWSVGGLPRVVFSFVVEADRVVRIDLVADPDRLDGFRIAPAAEAPAGLEA